MKLKAIKRAWYNNKMVEVDDFVDFDGDKVPSWGTLADGEVVGKVEKAEEKEEGKQSIVDTLKEKVGDMFGLIQKDDAAEVESDAEEVEAESDVQPEETPEQQLEYLKDLAVANDIWADVDEEKMTVVEQMEVLMAALKAKNIEV